MKKFFLMLLLTHAACAMEQNFNPYESGSGTRIENLRKRLMKSKNLNLNDSIEIKQHYQSFQNIPQGAYNLDNYFQGSQSFQNLTDLTTDLLVYKNSKLDQDLLKLLNTARSSLTNMAELIGQMQEEARERGRLALQQWEQEQIQDQESLEISKKQKSFEPKQDMAPPQKTPLQQINQAQQNQQEFNQKLQEFGNLLLNQRTQFKGIVVNPSSIRTGNGGIFSKDPNGEFGFIFSQLVNDMHKSCDRWPLKAGSVFFLHGAFNNIFYNETIYNPNHHKVQFDVVNGDAWKDKNDWNKLISKMSTMGLGQTGPDGYYLSFIQFKSLYNIDHTQKPKQDQRIHPEFNALMELAVFHLRQNLGLQKIGGYFQQQKILDEKSDTDTVHSIIGNILQEIYVEWIRQACDQIKALMKPYLFKAAKVTFSTENNPHVTKENPAIFTFEPPQDLSESLIAFYDALVTKNDLNKAQNISNELQNYNGEGQELIKSILYLSKFNPDFSQYDSKANGFYKDFLDGKHNEFLDLNNVDENFVPPKLWEIIKNDTYLLG